eukprot:CAMPEP_0206289850 /NCGR_PEP_ID=MMETSP0106_2-20121207/2323_1 /ASSEMBLY_ACC=CAM_ASM_000206 /TAXON_ID=81532 /ORGANISM="Acanthoeca-like sp., Strain 10tr" /LENGTH=140 /DNA_ID=CAMNT_0053720405 /DNA_START=118 /DNA_END=540 /DNA_ORIENTATION=+
MGDTAFTPVVMSDSPVVVSYGGAACILANRAASLRALRDPAHEFLKTAPWTTSASRSATSERTPILSSTPQAPFTNVARVDSPLGMWMTTLCPSGVGAACSIFRILTSLVWVLNMTARSPHVRNDSATAMAHRRSPVTFV